MSEFLRREYLTRIAALLVIAGLITLALIQSPEDPERGDRNWKSTCQSLHKQLLSAQKLYKTAKKYPANQSIPKMNRLINWVHELSSLSHAVPSDDSRHLEYLVAQLSLDPEIRRLIQLYLNSGHARLPNQLQRKLTQTIHHRSAQFLNNSVKSISDKEILSIIHTLENLNQQGLLKTLNSIHCANAESPASLLFKAHIHKAKILYRKSDRKSKSSCLQQYLEALRYCDVEKTRVKIKLTIADLYQQLSQPQHAEQVLNQLLTNPNSRGRAKVKLAEMNFSHGNIKAAIKLFCDIIDNPENSTKACIGDAYHALSEVLYDLGLFDQSYFCADEGLKIAPDNYRLLTDRCKLQLERGNIVNAYSDARLASGYSPRTNPDDDYYECLEGQVALTVRAAASSPAKLFNDAMYYFPSSAPAHLGLARVEQGNYNYSQAQFHYEQSIRFSKTAPNMLFSSRLKLKTEAEARLRLAQLLALQLNFDVLGNPLIGGLAPAKLQRERQKLQLIYDHLRRVKSIQSQFLSDRGEASFLKALIALQLQQYKSAEKLLKQSLEADERQDAQRQQITRLIPAKIRKVKITRARGNLRIKANRALKHCLLAGVYHELKRPQLCEEQIQRAKQLAPDFSITELTELQFKPQISNRAEKFKRLTLKLELEQQEPLHEHTQFFAWHFAHSTEHLNSLKKSEVAKVRLKVRRGLKTVLFVFPWHSYALTKLAHQFNAVSDHNPAMLAATQAIRLNPFAAPAYLQRGLAKLRKSNTHNEALNDFNHALTHANTTRIRLQILETISSSQSILNRLNKSRLSECLSNLKTVQQTLADMPASLDNVAQRLSNLRFQKSLNKILNQHGAARDNDLAIQSLVTKQQLIATRTLEQARRLIEEHYHFKATQVLTEYLQLKPDNVDALLLRAKCFHNLDFRFAETMDRLTAIMLAPERFSLFLHALNKVWFSVDSIQGTLSRKEYQYRGPEFHHFALGILASINTIHFNQPKDLKTATSNLEIYLKQNPNAWLPRLIHAQLICHSRLARHRLKQAQATVTEIQKAHADFAYLYFVQAIIFAQRQRPEAQVLDSLNKARQLGLEKAVWKNLIKSEPVFTKLKTVPWLSKD